ncbi:1182_t:CDS:1 [Funneliformis caledonium]|uniref:1182_t:CDS:1 n=1 Tax=Funneliformis caledonium TaxID=1117310 RepID=A0A9N9CT83_9GLOM|nr:1182_t:CDS:1 [Funneliformis caledonium]
MTLLPTECIQEILKHVQTDENLFSCLLVNHAWCINVIPLLWSDPFKYKEITRETKNFYFLDNYLRSLNQDETNLLIQQGINIFHHDKQIIDYVSFLKVIEFGGLSKIIENWMEYYIYIDSDEIFLKYYSNVFDVLLRLFMRQSDIQTLCINEMHALSQSNMHIILPDISIFTLDNPGIKLIKELHIHFAKGQFYEELLSIVSTLCTQIQIISLSLNRTNLPLRYFVNNIIRNQARLNSIALKCDRKYKNERQLNLLFKSLNLHVNWLKSIELSNFEINILDFSLIFSQENDHNLLKLTLFNCRLYIKKYDLIEDLKDLRLPINSLTVQSCFFTFYGNKISFDEIYPPLFFQIIGTNLKNLSLNVLDKKIINSILTYCTNINSLEVFDLRHQNFPNFFTLIKNLELTKLKISMDCDHDTLFLLKLIDNLPVTLNLLVLKNLRNFNNLHYFLKKFHAPNLSEIILYQKSHNYNSFFELLNNFKDCIEFIELRNVHTFGIEYEKNVNIDDINDFNQLKKFYSINKTNWKLKCGHKGFYMISNSLCNIK